MRDQGTTPKKKYPPRVAASNSFTDVEIRWMVQLLNSLLAGGDVTTMIRNRDVLSGWMLKLGKMSQRCEEMRQKRVAYDKEQAQLEEAAAQAEYTKKSKAAMEKALSMTEGGGT